MTDYKKEVAQALLDIQAVKLQPNDPFTWASGLKSPIYTDNRKTISFPKVRQLIANGLADLVKEKYPDATVIGGVATAGIPHAAWVAEVLDLPMVYVRSKPKDHGAGKQIEGILSDQDQVVLIDDLISTGGSVLGAVDAVRREGSQVAGVLSIFSYELPAADKNFAAAKTDFAPLTTYSALLDVEKASGQMSDADLDVLQDWRVDPSAWSEKHSN
ncbi:orotate phosphoribosyltransferase [Weissella viridescens]|uniref:Orotate phosphoribosyltransferase n=1 Tax=Weissella viridescens TaxID=1629 RepID=A0A0R2H5J4_WEIVI|nr:orotate phosphoribosyltransferase [Weissella viridescens]KRN45781.1 orotate phosphoribosyltransferase [Weissella viridescens]GEA95283.1 orotate phosphoribosyltransferase [Weissella viridescens]SOB44091.1 orotate phosphoribosyltransferase [Weissella viridescens]